MSIKTTLKREGIEVTYELNKIQVEAISKSVAKKIFAAFPMLSLDENLLTEKLYKLKMYKAKMPEGLAEANYFYRNTSIYFNEHINDEDLEEFAIHECIHYLQEIKEKNRLIRMGLRENRYK